MATYINTEAGTLKNKEGEQIGQAITQSGNHDFKYLGSWCDKERHNNQKGPNMEIPK